jgi:hypothetical protein
MVCYARPAGMMAAVVLVVVLVFGRPAAHFFDVAALMAAIAVAAGGAAVAAVLAFVAFGSIRRRRAEAGGCVRCQLRCQHAMTEQPRRLLVVSTVERGPGASERGMAAPRWPDRPAYRPGAVTGAAIQLGRRERAGSATLPNLGRLVRKEARTRPTAVRGVGPRTRRWPRSARSAIRRRRTQAGDRPSSPLIAPARSAPTGLPAQEHP